jgi:UDP-N-acetylmuramoyl-tripeptide--D-alanyl-D-alanine ligase
VLKRKFKTRASEGSYNNEFGLPLTILGEDTQGKNLFGWLLLIIRALWRLAGKSYSEVLILEMGADRPGDIRKLLAVTGRLDVAIVTNIGISHLQNYSSAQALANEKMSLLKGLDKAGLAVLNTDSEPIKDGAEKFRGNKMTYGMANADLSASDLQIIKKDDTAGINFKVHHAGTVVPFFLPNCLGQPPVYAALAACAAALYFKMNLVDASEALQSFEPPKGRLRFLGGIKLTQIIDDTYNAAPASTIAALDVLKQIAPGRKVAVIGDMAELGTETESGHKSVAVKIQDIGCEAAILVGEKGRIIFDELNSRKYSGKILWFRTSDEARMPVQNAIQEGDTILIKGSQAARMEKIVKEIMADPMNAEALIVRQSDKWLNTP